jgi:hypothetical protein
MTKYTGVAQSAKQNDELECFNKSYGDDARWVGTLLQITSSGGFLVLLENVKLLLLLFHG